MKTPKQNMQNTMELMKWFADGKLNPHIHKVYPLKETSSALEEMMARNVKGKVVIECNS